jgi:glycosyltransferase involved in cell wall biosynthesis
MSKSHKKITFFSVLPPFRGGIAQFSQELRKSLSERTEVSAFTFKRQYPDFLFPGQSQFEDGSRDFDMPRIASTFRPWSYLRALRAFRRDNGSVFITNYWMTFFGPMMGFWARFLPKSTVKLALIHNLIPHEKRFFDGPFNRFFLKPYDGFIVLSEAVKQDVLMFCPDARVTVLPHPSYQQYGKCVPKAEAQQKLGLDPTKKTLLFFGLIRPYKGLSLLLEAFSSLDDSYQIIIAGEVYGDRSNYDALMGKSRNTNIHFHDQFIPNERVQDYFSCADLCVLPYLSATQSGIKAMCDAFSLPTLVSKAGGLSEEIQEGVNGFILEGLNPEGLMKKIQEVCTESALYPVVQCLEENLKSKENEWGDFAEAVLKFSSEIEQSKN